VYHQYTLLSDHRERIMQALQDAGIASAIYYPVPLHRQNVFAAESGELSLPVTESVAMRCLSLPMYPELEDAAIVRIADVIRRSLNA
jgi:dTDP-4-amino-4,6-dideoxygalactose transaminase